ncbi:MAG TPA: multicopper oxidase domain-containing protein, partial [Gemmatimonadales bacterium]|nr:multicopper oxidase domain-containing protein [Gemmatimonadales bacterium]
MRKLIPLLFLAAACDRPAAAPATSTTSAAPQAPATAPADLSHGEAPIGTTTAPAEIDPAAPARSTSHRHKVRWEMKEARLDVTPQVTYQAWTFEGRVPGPILRVTVGDTVDFTLVNKAPMAHSVDFHAAQVAPSRVYTNVMPNDSIHYRWVAEVPGVFMYHCGTAPVAMHIANGMYGAVIVDPVRPRPAAREFVLVQSEFYEMAGAGKDSAVKVLDWNKLLSLAPDQVVFNGHANQ